MVKANSRLSYVAAIVATVAFGWCGSGLAQTGTTPAPAAPAAPAAAAPQPATTPAHAAAHKPTVRHGLVSRVQTALNASGAKLTVDGRMGPKTVAALKTFQEGHKLKVTGHPDKETRDALGLGRKS